MKYLILPDVHTRFELAERIIAHEKADKVIFLGDYFDDFGDDPNIASDTADWFSWSVHEPNRIHLCGNHDIHYWFDLQKYRCSGYEQFKAMTISEKVRGRDWEKLVFFYNLDNKWLLTHAGIHPTWLNQYGFTLENLTLESLCKSLENDSEKFLHTATKTDSLHWFAAVGTARGGRAPFGGILWCDWLQEFTPIRGISQIVGHTSLSCHGDERQWVSIDSNQNVSTNHTFVSISGVSANGSVNLCLDTRPGSRRYAIYEDGTLFLKESTQFLKK